MRIVRDETRATDEAEATRARLLELEVALAAERAALVDARRLRLPRDRRLRYRWPSMSVERGAMEQRQRSARGTLWYAGVRDSVGSIGRCQDHPRLCLRYDRYHPDVDADGRICFASQGS